MRGSESTTFMQGMKVDMYEASHGRIMIFLHFAENIYICLKLAEMGLELTTFGLEAMHATIMPIPHL